MTVTVAYFKQNYTEFKNTPNSLCASKLAAATRRVAPSVWGDRTDDGVMLLTAHLLSIAPAGEQARLKNDNRGDMYEKEWKQMKREVTLGLGRNT